MRSNNRVIRGVLWGVNLAVLAFALLLAWSLVSVPTGIGNSDSSDGQSPAAFKQVAIDLDKAVAVTLPSLSEGLTPAPFKTADGKSGWAIKIPGGRPLATPAYADGMVFIGGGYGSHEFYALNAQTGALVWKIKTSDDGPTAAVVEDGCVAFNTESCTVIVCDAQTGKLLWQEWLGDPLMSQPAISKGRLYIAHPTNQRGHQQVTNQIPQTSAAQGTAPAGRTSHKLLCADLKTGRHLWDLNIPADVISAPVVSNDKLYFTCFDGTSFCFDATSGNEVWKKANSGTSAPLIAGGDVIMTMKVEERGKHYEGMKRVDAARGNEKDKALLAQSEANYLQENQGGGVQLSKTETMSLDASVGFGSAPPAAKLDVANKQVGVNSVAGGWAYQGSRAAYRNGQMMNAQGRYLNCMRALDGKFAWRAEVQGAGVSADSQVFSPPALGQLNLYLCSAQGHLMAIRQKDGVVNFLYALQQPMTFQPALAQGNIYVGTASGLLICLKTGDRDADGWYAWGGNAQHNKND